MMTLQMKVLTRDECITSLKNKGYTSDEIDIWLAGYDCPRESVEPYINESNLCPRCENAQKPINAVACDECLVRKILQGPA